MQVCPDLGQFVSLRRLLPEAEILGADDIAISGCACDSRQVREGELFAALVGSQHDGHDFVAEAAARGCAAVLSDRPATDLTVPWCLVPNARATYARLCQTLAGNPSRQLKLIGVTGTNGKTTTSCLIAGILKAAGYRVGVLGTLGYLDGRIVEPAVHTTPPPERLAKLLARMVANECTHAVMEVSSHALDQSRVAGASFDATCVTNVTHDHLDYHANLRAYQAAKGKLFDHLAEEGFAVLNADDPGSAGFLRSLDCPALTVAIDHAAEIMATPVEQFPSEQTFLLTAGSETVPVRTQMIGTHHIYNCLTAAAVGLAYGIELTTVVRGLESVGHVPGRLERIECGQPFGVFVDFAHTPDCLDRRPENPRPGDRGAADLRVRRRRTARSPETSDDGSGRGARRDRHPDQRQSAPRRSAQHLPRRVGRFPQSGRGGSDSRSGRGDSPGADLSRPGRLRADCRQGSRKLSDRRRRVLPLDDREVARSGYMKQGLGTRG